MNQVAGEISMAVGKRLKLLGYEASELLGGPVSRVLGQGGPETDRALANVDRDKGRVVADHRHRMKTTNRTMHPRPSKYRHRTRSRKNSMC